MAPRLTILLQSRVERMTIATPPGGGSLDGAAHAVVKRFHHSLQLKLVARSKSTRRQASPQLGRCGKPQQADAKVRQRVQDKAVDVVFDVLDLRAVYLGLTGDHGQTVGEGVIDGESDITRYNHRI